MSLLWALSPDPFVRAEVLAAHDAAVVAALGWFEHHGAVTRRGRNGLDQVDTRGVAVAVFRQHTSRSADPQLHSHAIVAAKVQDSSGRWLSLDARFLKRQQRSIGWVGRPRPGPRAGDPAAVAAYAAHHRLQTVHPALVADRVARQFERLGARGHSVGVTTASAGTARAINVEIQRRRNPRLDGARVVLADGTTAFVGDRVATRCNVDQRTDKGAPARNRQTLDGQRRGRRRVTPAV